jgi:hypothetical protein
LHDYLGGVCKGLGCNPVRIGGYKDHIHVLCLLSRKVTQMKLVEELKKQSSKWIKTKANAYSNFYWQDGNGVFSIGIRPTPFQGCDYCFFHLLRALPFFTDLALSGHK